MKRKPFVYRCVICGEIAHYGYNVNIREGKDGTWYCVEHKPTEKKKEQA